MQELLRSLQGGADPDSPLAQRAVQRAGVRVLWLPVWAIEDDLEMVVGLIRERVQEIQGQPAV